MSEMSDGVSIDNLPTPPPDFSKTDVARQILGTVSNHFGVVDAWLDAMTGGGAAVWQGIQTAQAEGERAGYVLGFAAAIFGMDAAWVRNELDVWNREGSSTAEIAHWSGYTRALYGGYNDAMQLPPEVRQEFLQQVIDHAAAHGVAFTPHGGENMTMVYGIANLLEQAGKEVADAVQAEDAATDTDDGDLPPSSPGGHLGDDGDDASCSVDDDPGAAAAQPSTRTTKDDASAEPVDVREGATEGAHHDPVDYGTAFADEDDPGTKGNGDEGTAPGHEDDPGADGDGEDDDTSPGDEDDPASEGDSGEEVCYPEEEQAASEQQAQSDADAQAAYDIVDGGDGGGEAAAAAA